MLKQFFSFNYFYSFNFWISFAVCILLLRLVCRKKIIRDFTLLGTSILMLFALPMFDVYVLLFYLLLSFFVFIMSRYLIKTDSRRRYLTIFISTALVVCVLIYFKYSFLQIFIKNRILQGETIVTHTIFIVGISYISFKEIHILIDSYNKKLKELDLLTYLNYIFFFPSFISGPINRYEQFRNSYTDFDENTIRGDLKSGSYRIVNGLFKKLVLAVIVFPYTFIHHGSESAGLSAGSFILAVYAQTLYFYFDFSGYSDMAIGCAQVLGIRLPENFNSPFTKPNLQQLWNNWHMSLTRWLFDYIYWPAVKRLRKNAYFKKKALLLSNTGVLITFLVCGIWHGEGINFVLWGLYHGIGLSVLKIFQYHIKRNNSGVITSIFNFRYINLISTCITFNYFAFGMILFSLDLRQILQVIVRIF